MWRLFPAGRVSDTWSVLYWFEGSLDRSALGEFESRVYVWYSFPATRDPSPGTTSSITVERVHDSLVVVDASQRSIVAVVQLPASVTKVVGTDSQWWDGLRGGGLLMVEAPHWAPGRVIDASPGVSIGELALDYERSQLLISWFAGRNDPARRVDVYDIGAKRVTGSASFGDWLQFSVQVGESIVGIEWGTSEPVVTAIIPLKDDSR